MSADLIYLDNAATSWPKPPEVALAVSKALEMPGSPGRAAHRFALAASRALFSARKTIASYVGIDDESNLSFQPGCTQAANLVMRGLLSDGDRVLVSSVEHNSITRPLGALKEARGLTVDYIPADERGVLDLERAKELIATRDYRMVICQHASNVSGVIHPVRELGALAHEYGALFACDGAQAGGHLPVDIAALDVDAWFCSGHKGFLGPQGVGICYLAPSLEVEPLIWGGTGFGGAEPIPAPYERPALYEAGTVALPAILGFEASVKVVKEHEDVFRETESRLSSLLHEGLAQIDGIRVLGPDQGLPRVPIISIVSDHVASDQLAFQLDKRYGIASRAGLHCSPSTHKALGTLESGAVRFGVGPHNTTEEIEKTVASVAQIVAGARA